MGSMMSVDGPRYLDCPVCGVALKCDSHDYTYILPKHYHGRGGNLCEAYEIRVVFKPRMCDRCESNPTHGNTTGLCLECFAAQSRAGRPSCGCGSTSPFLHDLACLMATE